MLRVTVMCLGVGLLGLVGVAAADEPLPDAMRARLEKLAPIQQPIIYVPGAPARWLVFIGPTSAFSAWLVTPGAAGHELSKVEDWPSGLKVTGAFLADQAPTAPSDKPVKMAYLTVETPAAVESGQPAGIRTIIPIPVDGKPENVVYTAALDANLPVYTGVKDESDAKARVAAAAKAWAVDLGDDAKAQEALDAAKKSDAALAALIPSDGIAVYESFRGGIAKEIGRIQKLDGSPAVAALRVALAGATWCTSRTCNGIVVGGDGGKLVIRALLVPHVPVENRGAHKAVAANAKETQTAATARALGFQPDKVLGEAPLSDKGGTVGVIEAGGSVLIIYRDGDYAEAAETGGDGKKPPRFADFNGDGMTDVLLHNEYGPVFELGIEKRLGAGLQALQMASLDKQGLEAIAAAALTLEDGGVTKDEACKLLFGVKDVGKVLAPGGEIFVFQEPSQPGWGKRQVLKGAKRTSSMNIAGAKACNLVCDAHLPICVDAWEPPGVDYYLFTRAKGKLQLRRGAVYGGG
jgi:hypothetical protein